MQDIDILRQWADENLGKMVVYLIANLSSGLRLWRNVTFERDRIVLAWGVGDSLTVEQPTSISLDSQGNLNIADALMVHRQFHLGVGTPHAFWCELTYLQGEADIERKVFGQCFTKEEKYKRHDYPFVRLVRFTVTDLIPKFQIGQHVRVVLNERNRTPREGIILGMDWHYKRKCYYYVLREKGKVLTKWYFDDDFELLADNSFPCE